MFVGMRVDQLRGDPNLPAGSHDGSFHHTHRRSARARSPADGLRARLYGITDVREITRRALI